MKFSYRTLNNLSPLGRQNIYISYCTGEEKLRDELIDRILSCECAKDCACWYDEECGDSSVGKELAERLKNVSLIIFAVSNRMLTRRDRPLTVDLKIARSCCIPILPILVSGADYGEYSYNFENIPCAMQDDEYFAEDLESRLSLLLGSVQQSARLSDSTFCGKLYLCALPQDGLLTTRLAAVIREIEFCRDFALIRDDVFGEYKTPVIEQRHMIDDCDAVIIISTPHLLDQGNSIMDIVLPYSIYAGKPIIAVEMEPVNLSMIRNIDKDFPTPVSVNDNQRLRELLGDAVGDLYHANVSTPHRYLLGLSYLFSQGVEPNSKMALKLLTSAARDGLYDAQRQLAFIYRTGIGTERDIDSAILWQKSMIKTLTEIYNSDTSLENADSLAEALNELGSFYELLEQPDKAENAYDNCIALSKRRLRAANTVCPLVEQYAVAKRRKGNLRARKFDLKSAEENYRQALEFLNYMLRSNPSQDTLRSVGDISLDLGDICMKRGNFEDADIFYRRCYERRETEAEQSPTIYARRRLADILERLGQLYERVGDTERSTECFRSEIDIFHKLVEETDSIQERRDLAHALSAVYGIFLTAERFDEAEPMIKETIELRTRLAEETGSREMARELTADYDLLGEISKRSGDTEEAKNFFQRSLDARIKLANENPDDTTILDAVASTAYNIAMLDPDSSKSREYFEIAARTWDKLFTKTGERMYRDNSINVKQILNPSGMLSPRISLRRRER